MNRVPQTHRRPSTKTSKIRALVLAAQGKAFCAGANFNDRPGTHQEAPEVQDPATSLR